MKLPITKWKERKNVFVDTFKLRKGVLTLHAYFQHRNGLYGVGFGFQSPVWRLSCYKYLFEFFFVDILKKYETTSN